MRVLFCVSEMFPLVKTGGLADVAGSLPAALQHLGIEVRLLMPAYRSVLEKTGETRPGPALGEVLSGFPVVLREWTLDGPQQKIPVWLVDCPALYDRDGGPYVDGQGNDWPDNHLRFGLLSRTAALLARGQTDLSWRPDLVHVHDWQAALAPVYLSLHSDHHVKTLLTIHNIAYRGIFEPAVMDRLQIPQRLFALDGVEFFGNLSFLKGGIYFADAVSTVSPTHAEEIKTTDGGFGLHGLLTARAENLHGILNGADYDTWNPETDPALFCNYSHYTLEGKALNKKALLRELEMELRTDRPLFGAVGRLNPDKGTDLLLESLSEIVRTGAQVVLLGAGQRDFEQQLSAFAVAHPQAVHVRIGYDETLAHRIMAASDMFVMPSRVEPCGLTQLYALRYGTLPLVRKTGGLADTVVDVDAAPARGTGFVFESPSVSSLTAAAGRATAAFAEPSVWRETQIRAMEKRFDWQRSAKTYRDIYRQLLAAGN